MASSTWILRSSQPTDGLIEVFFEKPTNKELEEFALEHSYALEDLGEKLILCEVLNEWEVVIPTKKVKLVKLP